MESYSERRAQKCREAFSGFQPDFSSCRDPELARTILDLAREGKTSAQIAQVAGKTPKAIQKFFRRYDFPNLHNIEVRRMQEQPMWNGGEKLMKGYIYRRVPDHPNGTKHGNYVAVHRLVMERKLGRYLLPTEVVDHIDGNIQNNHPDNLRVFSSNAEHLRETLKGKRPNWSAAGKRQISDGKKEYWIQWRENKAHAIRQE
jgi:hypothetical protein